MIDGPLLWFTAAMGIIVPLAVSLSIMGIFLRSGHGAGWAVLSFVPMIVSLAVTIGGPIAMGLGLISSSTFIMMTQLGGLPLVIIMGLLALKSWPVLDRVKRTEEAFQ